MKIHNYLYVYSNSYLIELLSKMSFNKKNLMDFFKFKKKVFYSRNSEKIHNPKWKKVNDNLFKITKRQFVVNENFDLLSEQEKKRVWFELLLFLYSINRTIRDVRVSLANHKIEEIHFKQPKHFDLISEYGDYFILISAHFTEIKNLLENKDSCTDENILKLKIPLFRIKSIVLNTAE
jgi:hypothetical protein